MSGYSNTMPRKHTRQAPRRVRKHKTARRSRRHGGRRGGGEKTVKFYVRVFPYPARAGSPMSPSEVARHADAIVAWYKEQIALVERDAPLPGIDNITVSHVRGHLFIARYNEDPTKIIGSSKENAELIVDPDNGEHVLTLDGVTYNVSGHI